MVVERFGGVLRVANLLFRLFFWYRGFCHTTKSNLFLFLLFKIACIVYSTLSILHCVLFFKTTWGYFSTRHFKNWSPISTPSSKYTQSLISKWFDRCSNLCPLVVQDKSATTPPPLIFWAIKLTALLTDILLSIQIKTSLIEVNKKLFNQRRELSY